MEYSFVFLCVTTSFMGQAFSCCEKPCDSQRELGVVQFSFDSPNSKLKKIFNKTSFTLVVALQYYATTMCQVNYMGLRWIQGHRLPNVACPVIFGNVYRPKRPPCYLVGKLLGWGGRQLKNGSKTCFYYSFAWPKSCACNFVCELLNFVFFYSHQHVASLILVPV